jgi:hypothetical protein
MREQYYLIWSEEHLQWWASRCNYTRSIEEAARFSLDAASRIVEEANRFIEPSSGFRGERTFNEILIPDPCYAKEANTKMQEGQHGQRPGGHQAGA